MVACSTSRKGQQTANEGMSSIDPFTSFDNGAARDRVILESIAARTARTAATSSAPNSERFKNLPPFLQKTMQNMGDWPGAEYLKYKYYNYRKVLHLYLFDGQCSGAVTIYELTAKSCRAPLTT